MLFLSLIGKLAVHRVVVSQVTRYFAKMLLRARGIHNYSCESYCRVFGDYTSPNSNRFAYNVIVKSLSNVGFSYFNNEEIEECRLAFTQTHTHARARARIYLLIEY